jgi:hypothetical protein
VQSDGSDRPSTPTPRSAIAPAEAPLSNDQIDQDLFDSTVEILFNPEHRPDLFQPWETPAAATEAELAMAAEIVLTYRQLQRNQANPVVQSLNQLL